MACTHSPTIDVSCDARRSLATGPALYSNFSPINCPAPGFGRVRFLRTVLDAHGFDIAAANCTVEDIGDEAALCRRTAEAIAKGQVIGWFQGRMEWGPRA